jgi:uncharacterized protein GlcG (DUF336 family)
MPLYRFELRGRGAHQVQAGDDEELPDAQAAMVHAARVAKELSKGKRRAGLRKTLAVMDEQGNELAVIRISSAALLSQQ